MKDRLDRLRSATAVAQGALERVQGAMKSIEQQLKDTHQRSDWASTQFAKLQFGPRTHDDADPFQALCKVMGLLLDDQHPEYEVELDEVGNRIGNIRVSKARLLSRAVRALEAVVGRQFQREPLPREQMVDLATAGEYSVIRPNEVPEGLRVQVFAQVREQQSRMSRQYIDAEVNNHANNMAEAVELAANAIARGAFIVPFAQMPMRQQMFWLQKAQGYAHKPA